MKLWIDDERPMPEEFSDWVKSSQEAIEALEFVQYNNGEPLDLISFDHDLSVHEGFYDESRRVLLWMIENNVWPKEIRVHTANPVGHKWLVSMAQRYAPVTTWVDPRDPWK
jgi:hypothetical protein